MAVQRPRVIHHDRRNIKIGENEEDVEEEKKAQVEKYKLKKEGAMKAYDLETMNQEVGFVICENPDTLIDMIADYIEVKQGEEQVKCDVDEHKYKVSIELEGRSLSVDIKIYRIGEADEFFVHFVKTNGYLQDLLDFKIELEKHINQEFGYEEAQEEEQEEDQ